MLKAAIDIGSNSCLCLGGDLDEKGNLKILVSDFEITGLGKNLDQTGQFQKASMEETMKALQRFCQKLQEYQIPQENWVATATEAARVAKNAQEFFKQVEEATGLKVQILSGEGEAYYAALGVTKGITQKEKSHITIMDIGGASTELIQIQTNPFNVKKSISLPIGAVRAKDLIAKKQFDSYLKSLQEKEQKVLNELQTDFLVCIAGTMTSLGAIVKGSGKEFSEDQVHGSCFPIDDLKKLIAHLEGHSTQDLKAKFPFLGKRSETILPGAKVGLYLSQLLGVKELEISTYGLRYGIIYEEKIKEEFLYESRP